MHLGVALGRVQIGRCECQHRPDPMQHVGRMAPERETDKPIIDRWTAPRAKAVRQIPRGADTKQFACALVVPVNSPALRCELHHHR